MDELSEIRRKVARILTAFDRAFVEREREARLVLLAVLSGHHALLLGPPGTAKSLLARGLAMVLEVPGGAARTFEYLLTRFTHPDELFGPISLEGLKQEDYRRVTDGYLPAAEVAFLDEIFKANSAILNSLLGIVNERVFHCGRHRVAVPLVAMIGASNEPPDPEGGLGALYDRFLVRLTVEPIADGERFLAMALGEVPPLEVAAEDRLTLGELAMLRAAARGVAVPERVRRALLVLREGVSGLTAPVSDRRWRQAIELLKVAALTSGRAAVTLADLTLLSCVLGDPVEDGGVVRQALKRALEAGADSGSFKRLRVGWERLSERGAGASRLSELREGRIIQVGELEAAVAEGLRELDRERDAAMADAAGGLWQVGEAAAEATTRLVTAFMAARVGLERCAEALRGHRAELTGLDLHGEALERLRRAQATSQPERRAVGVDEVALWLATPGEEPDLWVPVSLDGWLHFEAAPRLAGRLQRRLLDAALAERRALDEVEPWHVGVPRLELDDEATWALLSEWGELRVFLEARGFAPTGREAVALRALSEWLRGAGVPRLPPPPEWPLAEPG